MIHLYRAPRPVTAVVAGITLLLVAYQVIWLTEFAAFMVPFVLAFGVPLTIYAHRMGLSVTEYEFLVTGVMTRRVRIEQIRRVSPSIGGLGHIQFLTSDDTYTFRNGPAYWSHPRRRLLRQIDSVIKEHESTGRVDLTRLQDSLMSKAFDDE